MSALTEELLEKLLSTHSVPHLLLFSRGGERAVTLAREFAAKWLMTFGGNSQCIDPLKSHPDIHVRAVEGKLGFHPFESIKSMLESMAYEPFQAAGKVFIIDHAERMLPSSANALLKNLEEPNKNTLIILIAHREDQLLPTIRSRSVKISLKNDTSKEQIELPPGLFAFFESIHTFHEAARYAEELADHYNQKKSAIEKELSRSHELSFKEMNAKQREKLQQEIEGAATVAWHEEIEKCLVALFSLYRDRIASLVQVPDEELFCEKTSY